MIAYGLMDGPLAPWLLTIADDLTGALEAGAKFANAGISARVAIGPAASREPGASVFVIDTETRHLSPREARLIVRTAVEGMRCFEPCLIYKKTDSTLRGNIAAELTGLLDASPESRIIYAPAYPAMGRTVRGGRLYVRGVPVHETAFAADPLNPIRESRIATMLAGVPVEIADGESDEDVRAIARNICELEGPLLVAGPGALAGALAEYIPLPRGPIRKLPRLTRCLVVNGSLHPVSAEQIRCAKANGCFGDTWGLFEYEGEGSGIDRAFSLGESVRRTLDAHPVDALIVFGGDTAFGVHQALGRPEFESYGEVVQGVPLSCAGGLFWITKAGGFGEPGILTEIRKRVT